MNTDLGRQIAADLVQREVSLDAVGEIVAELLRADEYMMQILAELSLRVLLVDRQGTVLAATPAALENVLGMEREQVLGQDFIALAGRLPVELAQAVEAGAAITAGQAWQGRWGMPGLTEWRLNIKPLGEQDAEPRLMLLLFEGDPVRLLDAAKVEQAERMMRMGQMSGTVIHNLKNSLQNISGYVQLLQLKYAGKDDEEAQNVLSFTGLISNELVQANRMVMSFLGMGRMDLRVSMQSLNDVVREALMMIYAQCHIKGIEITEQFDDSIPEMRMDKERIKQVIFNFVDNSIEAILEQRSRVPEHKGRICISTEFLSGGGADGADAVGLIIEDDGIGMAKDVLNNFLKPFFSTKKAGNGMGTSISAAIVHLHGGHIKIKSAPGQGCKIMLTLPCCLPQDIHNDTLLNEIAEMMDRA